MQHASEHIILIFSQLLEYEISLLESESRRAVAQGGTKEGDALRSVPACTSLRDLLIKGCYLYHQYISVWDYFWMVCLRYYMTRQSLTPNPLNMQSIKLRRLVNTVWH